MNTSQIRFVLTTNATWVVLRDPVLTLIYTRKNLLRFAYN